MSCGDCKNMIYKSDCRTDRFTAGIEDFCGAGCLIIDQIRVPHPDCSAHSMPNNFIRNQDPMLNTPSRKYGILEA